MEQETAPAARCSSELPFAACLLLPRWQNHACMRIQFPVPKITASHSGRSPKSIPPEPPAAALHWSVVSGTQGRKSCDLGLDQSTSVCPDMLPKAPASSQGCRRKEPPAIPWHCAEEENIARAWGTSEGVQGASWMSPRIPLVPGRQLQPCLAPWGAAQRGQPCLHCP